MSFDDDEKYKIDLSDIKKSLKEDFSFASFGNLIRWILLFPVITVIYIGIQTIAYALLKPYMQAFSDSLSDDFLRPLILLILYPLACLAIGVFSAYVAIKSVHYIAPTNKVQAIRVIAGLILLYAVSNILITFENTNSHSVEGIFPVLAVSGSAGVIALFYAFSRSNAEKIMEKNA